MQDDADRVEVCTVVYRPPDFLLWGGVSTSTLKHSRLKWRWASESPADPHVGDDHLLVGGAEHDVVRLDVSMDLIRVMDTLESVEDLATVPDRSAFVEQLTQTEDPGHLLGQ